MVYQSPDSTGASGTVPHVVAGIDTMRRRLTAILGEQLAGAGITLRGSHGRILSLIAADGSRPADLAHGWISKQAIGQRIGELRRLGLVSVEPDADDRRATVVRRTPAGDRLLTELNRVIADIERELSSEVGEDRYRVFRDVLDELVADRVPPVASASPSERPGGSAPGAPPKGHRRHRNDVPTAAT